MDTRDCKKEYKEFYGHAISPRIVTLPKFVYLSIDGKGDPNKLEYKESVEALYSIIYTVKMSKMNKSVELKGYFDFVVPPLEGFWWIQGEEWDIDKRQDWLWTSVLKSPDFLDQNILDWAKLQVKTKKPEVDVSKVCLKEIDEGLCVQITHFGSFAEEPRSVELMTKFLNENGYVDDVGNIRKHHEIYFSDPRKTEQSKLKTIIRHPIKLKNK